MSKRIRVLIIEDSLVVRELLAHIIGDDTRFAIVGMASSAEEGLAMLDRTEPDVISLDIRLPGMNGLDATLRIMSTRPTPIVVVSASVESDDLNIAMNALKAGALTVVEKPVGTSHQTYKTIARHICDTLALMSRVKVVRQGLRRNLSFGNAPPVGDDRGAADAPARRSPIRMLGLVASTGGPSALSRILAELPADFPVPILLVQHITDIFLEGFVTWLDGMGPLKVKLAEPGEMPLPGHVYVPPADRHLGIAHGALSVFLDGAVSGQRPSGTVLFKQMARDLGAGGLGVLLTGMGTDGAEGLLAMRRAGGYTIAEDRSTAVVYGMPAAAEQLGAACEMLPLPTIAGRIRQLVAASGRGA